MILVVDENIPGASRAFAPFGEIRLLPGRRIDSNCIKDAEVLIVRSVTRVDAALLGSSRVRFVGSTTAGVDHVNETELASLGIRFAHAPGSNAASVVDYLMSVLALCFPDADAIANRRVGIVGCGQVGGRLRRRLEALGIACRICDPLLPDAELPERASLRAALDCDVVSLHVPLTRSGAHATWHMIGDAELACLRNDALLINTARGPVVDNRALRTVLARRASLRAVLDVWEDEPAIDTLLAQRVLLGTPHIAGYALDGKQRGCRQVYEALCAFLRCTPEQSSLNALALSGAGELNVPPEPRDSLWQRAVLACYDVRRDASPLLEAARSGRDIAPVFDAWRRDYSARREFSAFGVAAALAGDASLRAAGFAS